MRNSLKLLVVGFVCSLSVAVFAADPSADAIMAQVVNRSSAAHSITDYTMVIANDNQTRNRSFRLYSSQINANERRSILFFLSPSDLRNTGFLSIDFLDDSKTPDQQWLYLPAFQKTKRISGEDRSKRFMGSDFSYYDMTRINNAQFTYKSLDDQPVNGKPCWHILATPKSSDVQSQIGYTKIEFWVQKDASVIVKANYTCVSEGESKQFLVSDMTLKKSGWIITHASMKTFRSATKIQSSDLIITNFDEKQSIDPATYTQKRLEAGV